MELNERLKGEIARVFRRVEYGRITFHLSPEKKTLDYTVETTGKIPAEAGPGGTVRAGPVHPLPEERRILPYQEYLIARGLLHPDGRRITRGLGQAMTGLGLYLREGGAFKGGEKLTWRGIQSAFRKEDGGVFSEGACRKARKKLFAY